MHKRFKIKFWCILTAISLTFTACGRSQEPEEERTLPPAEEEEIKPLTLTADIMVDRVGYQKDSDKSFIVTGVNLPDTYRIMSAKTGEAVYLGELKEKGHEETAEEYTKYGDFSDWKQTGDFYIECDDVGYSETFAIRDDMYRDVFNQVLQVLETNHKDFAEDLETVTAEEQLEQIDLVLIQLLSYELYPDVYKEQEEGVMPKILESAAGVVESLEELADKKTGEAGGCEYAYAALLAKFGYLVKEQDSKLSSQVLNLADKVWRYAEKNKKNKDGARDFDYRLLAAAELYRTQGQYKYRTIMEEYGKEALLASAGNQTVSGNQASEKQNSVSGNNASSKKSGNDISKADISDNIADEKKTREEYLAQITYLSTRRKVNVDICNQFMKELMAEAETITSEASRSSYWSAADGTQKSIDKLMWDMTVLSVVDYVITNHEYGLIMENQHHYLCGRNPQGHVFWDPDKSSEGSEKGLLLTDKPAWTAAYLLLLCSMLDNPQ